MKYNLQELYNELLDQQYELVPDTNLMVIDYDDVVTAVKNLEQELREIHNQRKKFVGGVIDKAIWLFVGELLGE